MEKAHGSIYKTVAEVLHLEPEDDLVEVACGTGHFLQKYASHVHSVAGLDHPELMVKLATRKHQDRIKAGTAEVVHGESSLCSQAIGGIEGSVSNTARWGKRSCSTEVNAEDGKDHYSHLTK